MTGNQITGPLHAMVLREGSLLTSPEDGNAGIDLRASGTWVVDLDGTNREVTQEVYTLAPDERILVKTGIALALPPGTWGSIRDRSGLAMKQGLHTLGGVIDENYRGEIGVVLLNHGKKQVKLTRGDRIAQLIVVPYLKPQITMVPSLPASNRGENGFGSSGR